MRRRFLQASQIFGMLFVFGCATSGAGRSVSSSELTESELVDFSARLRGTVTQELREAATPAVIRELAITHSRRLSDGSVKLGYHLEFDTQDSDAGQVTHRLDSEATIERDVFQITDSEQAVVWRLVDTTPPEQALVFHDPMVVESKAPPPAGAP